MKSITELKQSAQETLRGKWGDAIIVTAIFQGIINLPGLLELPWLGLLTLILSGPLSFGLSRFFIQMVRAEKPSVTTLFDGFQSFEKTFMLWIIVLLSIIGWCLLLVIPGIIAALRLSLSFYILNDHPEYSPREAIRTGKALMTGQKGKLFRLLLSFIGWGILTVTPFILYGMDMMPYELAYLLALGLGIVLSTYINTSMAHFYHDLKNENTN